MVIRVPSCPYHTRRSRAAQETTIRTSQPREAAMRQSRSSVFPETGTRETRTAHRFRARSLWLTGATGVAAVLAAAGLMASATPANARGQDRSTSPAEGSLVSATHVQ